MISLNKELFEVPSTFEQSLKDTTDSILWQSFNNLMEIAGIESLSQQYYLVWFKSVVQKGRPTEVEILTSLIEEFKEKKSSSYNKFELKDEEIQKILRRLESIYI